MPSIATLKTLLIDGIACSGAGKVGCLIYLQGSHILASCAFARARFARCIYSGLQGCVFLGFAIAASSPATILFSKGLTWCQDFLAPESPKINSTDGIIAHVAVEIIAARFVHWVPVYPPLQARVVVGSGNLVGNERKERHHQYG
jgi:hypothetical protein